MSRRLSGTLSAPSGPEVGAGYLGVEVPRCAGQPALRGLTCPQDPLSHYGAGLAARRAGEVGGADGGDLDLDVHPVQQRPG